jgi:hypothetical protein
MMNKIAPLFLLLFLPIRSVFLIASAPEIEAVLHHQVMTGEAPDHDAAYSPTNQGKRPGSRQTVIDSVPAPGVDKHMGLGWDGMHLWHITNNIPINAFQFDTVHGTVIDQIATTLTGYIHGCTYLNGSLWIQEWQRNGTMYEIDPNSGAIISSFMSPGGRGSRGLTNDGTNLWCFATGGSINNGTAYQLTTTGTLLRSCDISGSVQWPMDASYNSQRGTFIIIDNGTANSIKELDCSGDTATLVDEFSHPDDGNTPTGITYDGQFLWTCAFYGTWIYQIDIGDPPPAPPEAILFVDDDAGASYETYWGTSFGNLHYPFDQWVVADSGSAAPDSSDMGNYTIIVWTTADDYSSPLTPSDTLELGKWLAAGGKLWLSSQDALYGLGPVSWMHLAGYTGDVGCDSCMGIGPVMNGTSFPTAAGVFPDFSDLLIPDALSRAEVLRDYADTNSVAIDTSAGEPYFVFFNAFGWENINDEADRDTMMKRILTWMGYAPPPIDAATQIINWPGTSVFIGENGNPTAGFRNAGMAPITFDVYLEIDSSGTTVYAGNVQSISLDVGACTTWVFDPTWTASPLEGTSYDVSAYVVMVGDDNPSNDTIMQSTITTSVSPWIRCANRPSSSLCHATCYDPVGDHLYALGGGDGSSYYNYNYRYDPTIDAWATMTPLPVSINWIDASVCAWNRSIYVFGGYDGSAHNYNYIYDINGDSWSTGAPLPVNRSCALQAVYNDSLIYFCGGYDGMMTSAQVYIYNTYTDSWTTGTAMPQEMRMGGGAILGDTIWISGGYDGNVPHSTLHAGIIEPTNCESITWSTGAALPDDSLQCNGASMMYRDGYGLLCLVGGFTGTTGGTITNHAWEYNIGLDTWKPLPHYPGTIARNDILVARTAGDTLEIYVNGGDNGGSWTPTAETWKLKYHTTGIKKEKSSSIPIFGLGKISPNPVALGAVIAYTTMRKGPVSLKIYDITGRQIRTLVHANENAGNKTVCWDGTDGNHQKLSTGVYFCRLTAGEHSATKKIVVIK